MDRYTHLAVADQTAALDVLPDLTAPEGSARRATGADDSVLASCLASKRSKQATSLSVEQHASERDECEETLSLALANAEQSSRITGIRTSDGMADISDLKSAAPLSQQGATSRRYANRASGLAANLALSDPNLVAAIDAWPKLPEPIRAGAGEAASSGGRAAFAGYPRHAGAGPDSRRREWGRRGGFAAGGRGGESRWRVNSTR